MSFDVPETLSFRHPSYLPIVRSTPRAAEPEPEKAAAVRVTGVDGDFSACNGEYYLAGIEGGVATFRSTCGEAVLFLHKDERRPPATESRAPSVQKLIRSLLAALAVATLALVGSWAAASAHVQGLDAWPAEFVAPVSAFSAYEATDAPGHAHRRLFVDAAHGRRQALLAPRGSVSPQALLAPRAPAKSAEDAPVKTATTAQVQPDGRVTFGHGSGVTSCQPIDMLPKDKKVAVFPAAVDGSDGSVLSGHILMEVEYGTENPVTFLLLDGSLLDCGDSLPFGLLHGNMSSDTIGMPAQLDHGL